MASTEQPTSARLARKGKKSGPVTEYCALFHIKPGRAKQLVDEIAAGLGRRGDPRDAYKTIGVHDARFVVLDEGTRLLVTISFDLDFDPYFDDAIASLVAGDKSQIGFDWIEHLEEAPEGGYSAMSWEDFKNFLVASQVEADIFANTERRDGARDRQGSATAAGVPTGARQPRGRRGPPAPGVEAAARRSSRLNPHRWSVSGCPPVLETNAPCQ